MRKLIDLTGKRFTRLTVLERAWTDIHRRVMWRCVCDCETETIVAGKNLRGEVTKSCGCLRSERVSETHRIHGHSYPRSPEYHSWLGAIRRVECPDSATAPRYSGVQICERWRSSFEAFLEDMCEKPEPKQDYSIDRIDPFGGYTCGTCPECRNNGWSANCRWATRSEQRLNQRQLVAKAA